MFFAENMGKAKKKSHKCQTHEECRNSVCFLCLRKGDGRGISPSMEKFILQQSICNDFLLDRPFLPSGSCSSCRNLVTDFFRTGKSITVHLPNDYQSIVTELRTLPIETRNSSSKLDCRCQICQIARSKGTESKMTEVMDKHEISPKNVRSV